MKTLSCIIVDDEPVARKILREFTMQVSFLELRGEFENAVKAETWLQSSKADLIFLDIEMPKRSGLEYLKKSVVRPLVILTTAYPEYAIEGYELDIIDYLLKPIAFTRFQKAVQKAKEYAELRSASNPHPSSIFVRSEKKIEKLELSDILYIESVGNYVSIVTETKKILAYLTLKGIEHQLPQTMFIKIHQSFLVNFQKIESLEGSQVKVKNHLLPVSRNYRDALMQIIEKQMLKR
jgi:DNA-binding LytR/AlgR family response regulator